MRLPGSAQMLEARRRRALTLVQQGLSLNGAARRLGCAASSVMRWVRAHRRQGKAGLKVRVAPGRPRVATAVSRIDPTRGSLVRSHQHDTASRGPAPARGSTRGLMGHAQRSEATRSSSHSPRTSRRRHSPAPQGGAPQPRPTTSTVSVSCSHGRPTQPVPAQLCGQEISEGP